MVFDVAMTIFFWIEFGSISGQKFNLNFRMIGKIVSNFLAGMNTGAIPNQDDVAWHMPLQVFECLKDLLTMNCTFKMSFVDFT